MPPELNFDNYELKADPERPPPIFITSPDSAPTGNMLQNLYFNNLPPDHHPSSPALSHHSPQRPSTPLTVQTHNLVRSPHHQHANLNITIPSNYLINDMQSNSISPNSLSAYHNTNTLPPSPSPSSLMSDDDASSLYSPHSPHTPSNPTAESSGSSSDYRQSNDSSSLHPMHHSGQITFSLSHNMGWTHLDTYGSFHLFFIFGITSSSHYCSKPPFFVYTMFTHSPSPPLYIIRICLLSYCFLPLQYCVLVFALPPMYYIFWLLHMNCVNYTSRYRVML